MEINTDFGHIHILVSIPPKLSFSEIFNMIKVNTSSAMRKGFPFLYTVYCGGNGI